MVLPQIVYKKTRLIRPPHPTIPGRYNYENRRVHRGREARRALTVKVQRLPRSMRPPSERAARASALQAATANARQSVYETLANMNHALMNYQTARNIPKKVVNLNLNLTKATNKIRLPSSAENNITAIVFKPNKIIIEVKNKVNGNAKYMKPNTFKQFVKNGVYVSPYTRQAGIYRILNATYNNNNNKKQNNKENYLKKSMEVSKRIEKQRKRYERNKKLIPTHLIGAPNTSGNVQFARYLQGLE